MDDLIYPCENCGCNEGNPRWCSDCLITGNPLEKLPLFAGGEEEPKCPPEDLEPLPKTGNKYERGAYDV